MWASGSACRRPIRRISRLKSRDVDFAQVHRNCAKFFQPAFRWITSPSSLREAAPIRFTSTAFRLTQPPVLAATNNRTMAVWTPPMRGAGAPPYPERPRGASRLHCCCSSSPQARRQSLTLALLFGGRVGGCGMSPNPQPVLGPPSERHRGCRGFACCRCQECSRQQH
jgi:hypothetical protein